MVTVYVCWMLLYFHLVTKVTVVMGDLDAAEPEILHDGPVKSKL